MERILVSACLLGAPVRHDGGTKTIRHALMDRWRQEGRFVAICPEMAGGLPAPRPPAELAPDGSGRIIDRNGADVTGACARGAEAAVALARNEGCRFALLKDRSPSCGVALVHDGTFRGRIMKGRGVAARAFAEAGVAVYSEHDIEALAAAMARDAPSA